LQKISFWLLRVLRIRGAIGSSFKIAESKKNFFKNHHLAIKTTKSKMRAKENSDAYGPFNYSAIGDFLANLGVIMVIFDVPDILVLRQMLLWLLLMLSLLMLRLSLQLPKSLLLLTFLPLLARWSLPTLLRSLFLLLLASPWSRHFLVSLIFLLL
jgi:hypothetical protein